MCIFFKTGVGLTFFCNNWVYDRKVKAYKATVLDIFTLIFLYCEAVIKIHASIFTEL